VFLRRLKILGPFIDGEFLNKCPRSSCLRLRDETLPQSMDDACLTFVSEVEFWETLSGIWVRNQDDTHRSETARG